VLEKPHVKACGFFLVRRGYELSVIASAAKQPRAQDCFAALAMTIFKGSATQYSCGFPSKNGWKSAWNVRDHMAQFA
jgi:hypothetical protein